MVTTIPYRPKIECTRVVWCELRDSFRHFGLDRISEITSLEDVYETIPGRTLQDFLDQCE